MKSFRGATHFRHSLRFKLVGLMGGITVIAIVAAWIISNNLTKSFYILDARSNLITTYESCNQLFLDASGVPARFEIAAGEIYERVDNPSNATIFIIDYSNNQIYSSIIVTDRIAVSLQKLIDLTNIKELAEELRVLYVTLTRAQERLILTGTVRDFSQSLVDWRIAQIQPSLYKSALDIAMSAVIGCPGCELLGGQTKMQKPQVNLRVCAAPDVVPKTSGGSESMLERVDDLLQSELWDEDTYNAYRWHYPELNRPYAPLKLAVTGLEKEFTGGGELGRIKTEPGFISGRDGSVYTKRGTAVHIALQNLDYDPLRGERDYARVSMEVARQLNRMADQKLLLPAERELVRPAMIADFVLSPLGQRVLNAPYFRREWSFTLFIPTERVIPGYPAGERLIVQGTIDLCFLEEDEWVLVDYKTDRAADDEEIISRYGTQIDVYAEALQALTGKKVKQAILCLVRDGRTIEIQPKIWNKQER